MSDRYSADRVEQEDCDGSERFDRKIANDVRVRIRRVAHHPPFSQPWLEMIEPLKFIAELAGKEMRGQRPTATSTVQGTSTEQTVWETGFIAVRVIVEEGKINLLARGIREFKETVYALPGGTTPTEMSSQAAEYEASVTTILRACLAVVECVQTIDITSLLEHVAMVLAHALDEDFKASASEVDTVQELAAIHYLAETFKHVERLRNGDQVCAKVLDLRLVQLVVAHLKRYQNIASPSLLRSYLVFFASLADTDTFKAKMQDFFGTKDERKNFAVSFDPLAKEYITKNGLDAKKELRPLTDLVLRWK
jgi:hypothetical protein